MLSRPIAPLSRRQGLRFFTAGLIGAAGLPAAVAATVSQSELERALEKLLKERPELVRDALNTLEQREVAARQQADKALLASVGKQIYTEAGATVLGNPAGDVTLVEFMDYRCGYCKHLQADLNKLIAGDRQLRVLVKHLPILGPESLAAAQLVLSAGQGAGAQQLHQRLLSSTPWDAASLSTIKPPADAKGLDKAQVERGLGDVRQLAERLNIQGTPALLVGEYFLRGAAGLDQLQVAVQTTRQRQAKKPVARV